MKENNPGPIITTGPNSKRRYSYAHIERFGTINYISGLFIGGFLGICQVHILTMAISGLLIGYILGYFLEHGLKA